MIWYHPALAQRALDEGDSEIAKLRAENERLRADLAASERLREHANRELAKDSALVEELRAELHLEDDEWKAALEALGHLRDDADGVYHNFLDRLVLKVAVFVERQNVSGEVAK